MRQGQQNRRGRGRNRKGPQNPLTRSFESNGPDVKVRGTPAHIAEKYMSLARDAQSSGDPVLAENYLQHAEHYNRIILAVREQQMQQGGGDMMNGRPRQGGFEGEGDDYGDDDGDDMMPDLAAGMGPQPSAFDPQRGGDAQGGHGGGSQQPQQHYRQDRGDRPHHQRFDRQDRQERQDRHERGQHHQGFRGQRRERYGEGRPFGGDRDQRGDRGMDRPERQPMAEAGGESAAAPGGDFQPSEARERREPREFREPRPPREPREPREAREPQEAREPRGEGRGEGRSEARGEPRGEARGEERPRRREQFGQSYDQQPEFLRRPVRRPRREAAPSDAEGADAPRSADDAGSDKTTV